MEVGNFKIDQPCITTVCALVFSIRTFLDIDVKWSSR